MAESSHKRIVITGATRGLGRALAEGFARLGHTVIGCGRDARAIELLLRGHGRTASLRSRKRRARTK